MTAPASQSAATMEQARLLGVECVDSVTDEMLVPELIANLSVDWARTHGLLPVRWRGDLRALTATPAQVEDCEALCLLVGEDLAPLAAPADVVLAAIERCYYRREDAPAESTTTEDDDGTSPAVPRSDDLLRSSRDTPVTQFVNTVLLEAVKRGASDVHFEPFEFKMRVRYRIDGNLYEQGSPPRGMEDSLVSRLKVMAHLDIAEKRLPQDGMARVRVGEREIDLRVSTVPVPEGERVVLRLLDRDHSLLPLGDLGMPERIQAPYAGLLAKPHGLIIVCGPTGSGKTTTLYASLQGLDAARRNIMTIEDPIEYRLPNIGQIQVRSKIGLNFAGGLKHILRQDPDIILVGETRDLETAEIALRASLTGHLVFTTLHTNDAPGSVMRLVDIGVDPHLLASCLRGVLAQRLIRTLCLECRRATVLSEAVAARLGGQAPDHVGANLFAPVGCDACLEGYHGRQGVFELLLMSEAWRESVREGGASEARLAALAAEAGMRSLREDAFSRLLLGTTSVEEVLNLA